MTIFREPREPSDPDAMSHIRYGRYRDDSERVRCACGARAVDREEGGEPRCEDHRGETSCDWCGAFAPVSEALLSGDMICWACAVTDMALLLVDEPRAVEVFRL